METLLTQVYFQAQTMTALDIWLLMAKIILFLELIEYAIVLHIRFSNAKLNYLRIPPKQKKPKVSTEKETEEEMDELIMARCKSIDSRAFLGFLIGSIFINFVYFIFYC